MDGDLELTLPFFPCAPSLPRGASIGGKDGNALGFAVGQPTWVSKTDGSDAAADSEDDPGFAYELFYKFQVTDNISVTPALTLLTKPYSNDVTNNEVNALSGLIKTTFTF